MALDSKLISETFGVVQELNEFKEMKDTTKKSGRCALCKSDKTQPHDFKDHLSRKEWKISFTCQKCQDELWDNVLE